MFAALGIERVVVTRLNDYMPLVKKLLAPALKFKQDAAGRGQAVAARAQGRAGAPLARRG